jgi:muconolactone delta-isomerase
MKILALESPVAGVTDEQLKPHLEAESRRVWELYQQGIIREIYFAEGEHRAALVLECSNTEEAQKVIDSLPLVRERCITFKLLRLKPYTGFGRLFKEA